MNIASKRQETEVVANIVRFFPYGKISAEHLQYFVEHPDELADVLLNALTTTVEKAVGQYLVDTSVSPFLPSGWKVEEHKQGGLFLWDPTKVNLFLSNKQKNGKVIGGHDLRKELSNQPVLNANVLDYLLAHPELIPEEWKGKAICFWGTIYRYSAGNLCVRCLVWFGGRWCWDCRWLDFDWRGRDPAAVSASV